MYSISFTREMNRVPKAIHYRNLSEPWHITQKHIPLQLWFESEHLYAARRSKETFLVGLSLFPLFINPFIMIYMFNYIHQQSLKAGLILSFISSIVHIQMAKHFCYQYCFLTFQLYQNWMLYIVIQGLYLISSSRHNFILFISSFGLICPNK